MTGKQLKNSILQWAIQGKLVPQDPNDEPASVLLEKIRQEKERLIKEKKIKRDKNASFIFRGEDNSYYEKLLATGEVKCIDEEIPFEIPQGWEWCRLGDVIQLLSGRDLEPYQYNSDGIGIPYMTGASNFCHEELIVNRWTEVPITVSHFGDLLITCKGTIGTMAFNNIGDIHIARQIMGISSSYVSLKYIKLCLEIHVAELQKAARSIIPGISRDDMLYAIIPLPPIKEQERISDRLADVLPFVDKYGDLQCKLDRLNTLINELLKKSTLQQTIQGKLVPQIAEEGTARELLEQIRQEKQKLVEEGKLKKTALTDSIIYKGEDNRYYEKIDQQCKDITEEIPFEIPENWEWSRIGSILSIWSARRVHEKDWRESGVPFYRAREIGKIADFGHVDNELFIDKSLYNEFSKHGVPQIDDLMMTAVGTLGKTYVVESRIPFYFKDGSVLCIGNPNKINPYYLKLFFESSAFINQYQKESDGTTVSTLTMVRLNQYLIPLPPLNEQQRIVAQIERLFEQLK